MSDRQNTIVCIFDPVSPRISAYQIHEWIYEQLRLPEQDVRMVQIDGPRRRVYLKFTDNERVHTVLRATNGQSEFRHDNGEISHVQIELAGMGKRRIRIANLPPEVSDGSIRATLAKYGNVNEIHEESWSRKYRYPVSNGIRIATVTLAHHIPSYMSIDGNRVLISYDGQPPTCYGCNQVGHQYQDCPHRRRTGGLTRSPTTPSWADIVSQGAANQRDVMEERAPTDTQTNPNDTQREAPNDSISREESTQPLETAEQPGTSGRPPTLDDDTERQQNDTQAETMVIDEDTQL